MQIDQIIEKCNSAKLEEYHHRSEGEECVYRECKELIEATIESYWKVKELDSKVGIMALRKLCSDVNTLLVEHESNIRILS